MNQNTLNEFVRLFKKRTAAVEGTSTAVRIAIQRVLMCVMWHDFFNYYKDYTNWF